MKPLLKRPVGLELGKSIPLWGKLARILVFGKKEFVPTSAVESPNMKMAGVVKLTVIMALETCETVKKVPTRR